jgi:hypothetical protein
LYLESLYDFGLVGAGLLVLVHIALAIYLARLGRRPGAERYLALGSFGAVAASLLHGLTGSELWHFSVGTYFFAIAFLPLTTNVALFVRAGEAPRAPSTRGTT